MSQISKNFSWEEMSFSSTASRLGLDNTIPPSCRGNMERLVSSVLQPIREKWGKPIVVSSGYRCPQLNKAVGGVSTSQHACGSAADIHTLENTLSSNGRLWDLIISMAKKGEIHCRQIIWEYGRVAHGGISGPKWIHLAVNDASHAWQDNKIIYVGVAL